MNANEKPPSKKSSIFSLLTDDKEPSLNESNSSSAFFFQTNQQGSTSSLTETSPPQMLQTKRSFEDLHAPMLPSISTQLPDSSQNLASSSKKARSDEESTQYNIPLSKESVMDVATLLLDLDRRDKLSSASLHNDETTGGSCPVNSSSINNNLPGIYANNIPRDFFNNVTLPNVASTWMNPQIPILEVASAEVLVPRRSSSLPSSTIPQYHQVTYIQPSASFPLPSYKQAPNAQAFPTEAPLRRGSFPPSTTQNNNNNHTNLNNQITNNIPSNSNNSINNNNPNNNYFPASQRRGSEEKVAVIPQQSRSIKTTDTAKDANQFTHTYFDDQWMTHYRELSRFKAIYGHVNVTRTLPEWRSLGNWVAEQRRKMRKGKLSRQQFDMLHEIGFEWDRSYYFKAAVPSVYANEESSKSQNQTDE